MHFLRAPFNIKWFLVKSQLFKNKYLGRTKIEIPSGKTEKKTSNSKVNAMQNSSKFFYVNFFMESDAV